MGALGAREGNAVNNRRVRSLAVAAVLVVTVLVPQIASAARWEPIKRFGENLVWSPFDLALSPATGAVQTHRNLQAGKRGLAQKIVAYPIGFLWFTAISASAAPARAAGAIMEFPVALVSLVSGWNPGPIFSAAGLPALIEYPNAGFDVRVGLFHVSD
jgi:hypothetical protein